MQAGGHRFDPVHLHQSSAKLNLARFHFVKLAILRKLSNKKFDFVELKRTKFARILFLCTLKTE